MAFDDVTFLELHLDDARFGRAGGADDEIAAEPSSGGARLPLGLLVLAGIGAAVAVRRLRRGPSIGVDLDEADAEAIAVE